MSYDNIHHLKQYICIMFSDKLSGREVQLINDYLECAYMRGRIDELKDSTGRLANTPKGAQDAAH